MAIRCDASTETAARTTNLPTATSFTNMGWFRLAADRGVTTTFMAYGNEPSLQTSDGTTLQLWNGATAATGSVLLVNRWYHLAWTFDGTTHTAYINGDSNFTLGNSITPDAKLWYGNNTANDWMNGYVHGVKVWSAVLTSAEIRQEMQQIVPLRKASLNSWYPTDGNKTSMLQEGGGQFPGRVENVLTATGTLTFESGPPVPWQLTRRKGIWDVPTIVSSAFMPRPYGLNREAIRRASGW